MMEKQLCSSRRDTHDITVHCLSDFRGEKNSRMQSVLGLTNMIAIFSLTLAVMTRRFVSDPTPAWLDLAGVIFLNSTHIQ